MISLVCITGSWQLQFGIYGAGYRGGVDDILILPGPCDDSQQNVTGSDLNMFYFITELEMD